MLKILLEAIIAASVITTAFTAATSNVNMF